MKLTSASFSDGQRIPDEFAFCNPDKERHVHLGKNRSPHLSWSTPPEGTRSFALICHDPDAPSRRDDANQENRTVPAALPRVDFFHWVIVDIPADVREIGAGQFSDEVMPRGKAGGHPDGGSRQGINSYTEWFDLDNDMKGDYFGYDGPCPPWNDELVHRYIFTLYAVDTPPLPANGKLTGPSVREALRGHILAEAALTGIYSLNPATIR